MPDTNFTSVAVDNPVLSKYHKITDIVSLGAPILAATNRYVTSVNLTNIAFTLANQPDVPRNVTVTITDTTPSIVAGTITVIGFDIANQPITEVFTFPATPAASRTFTGVLMFAQITSITAAGVTVLGGAGDELLVAGCGTVIALPNPILTAAAVNHAWLAGVKQTTPTIAVGVSQSGVDASAGTYNGVKILLVSYNLWL
jgi:hypothetical protein